MNLLRRLTATGIERARSARPVTWLTLVGVLVLPALIGGALVAALYNPTERLDNMSAAIVNLDEPVTIQDQYTPLGRQLAAGLVDGSDDLDSNLDWVLSNKEDAAEGLADGTYQAVVTIPKEFSAAATSSGQRLSGEDTEPEQATIRVVTAPDARLADEMITSQIASVATSSMGRMLSEATLSNVLIGFGTLGDKLGEAEDGAVQLADGATQLADGVTQLGSGAGELASGAGQLADGATQVSSGAAGLSGGATELANGVHGLAQGASGLADGANQLAAGANALSVGLNGDGTAKNPGLAPGLRQVANGATALVSGLRAGADKIVAEGIVPAEITTGAQDVSGGLASLATRCADSGADAAFCAELAGYSDGATQLSGGISTFATEAPTELAAKLDGAANEASTFTGGLDRLATGAAEAATGASQLATGVSGLAGGAAQLSQGTTQLAGGADQLASGASQLATGASGIATGTSELATGASGLAEGTSQLATGAGDLATGTTQLGEGLGQATEQLPSFDEDEANSIASVVSDPVAAANGTGVSLFGAAAIPLLAAIVLWFGGLATFIVMRSVTARALTSRRSSVFLAGSTLLPAAVVGAIQGILVAAVVQIVSGYEAGTALGLFALCALVGVAFAAIHQALVALFGGAGRWVAALIGAIALATGIVSTLPGWLASLAGVLPTSPAYRALLGVVTEAGGTGGAIVAMLVWAVLAFVITTLAVARKRTASARLLLA